MQSRCGFDASPTPTDEQHRRRSAGGRTDERADERASAGPLARPPAGAAPHRRFTPDAPRRRTSTARKLPFTSPAASCTGLIPALNARCRRPNGRLQNPLFGGYAAIESYLPSKRISIALAVTFKPSAFDSHGNYTSHWQTLYGKIGAVIAPRNAPLTP